MQAQTVNISLPKQLLQIVDKAAKEQFATRSDLIRLALVSYIQKQVKWRSIFAQGEQIVKKTKTQEKDLESIIDDYRSTSA